MEELLLEELIFYKDYERLYICRGHLFRTCDCSIDEKNQQCPNYKEVSIYVKKEDIKRAVISSIDNKL